MPVKEGDTLPGARLIRMGPDGPEEVSLGARLSGRRVVIFGVPGAFTPTCHSAHVPSFIRTRDDFAEKGIDEIICISVNDPFVLKAWSDTTGAAAAGITTLADPESAFTTAIGMNFDAPPVGLIGRSSRYAMVVENGVVKTLHREEAPGVCDTSGGEALLATL